MGDAEQRDIAAGRGESGLVRVGVAHLAEPLVAPALAAFQRWSQATPVAVFDDVIVLVRPSR